MRVAVITNDKYLFRYAELELCNFASVTNVFDKSSDALIFDSDAGLELPLTDSRIIKISRKNEKDTLQLPIPRGTLRELLEEVDKKPRLSLADDEKGAILDGEIIKLTSHEFSLLSLLLEGGEEFTTREDISKKVWGEASDGLINIYIHYLREKLEKNGEKIIVSSRKYGYKINSLYICAENKFFNAPGQKGAAL